MVAADIAPATLQVSASWDATKPTAAACSRWSMPSSADAWPLYIDVVLYPTSPLHILFTSRELNAGHFLLYVNSQPLPKPPNPLELISSKSLYEAGELSEAKLILLHCHITLD